MRNRTELREFILLGLSNDPQLQGGIFVFLFIAYMLSIMGNLTIITLTLLSLLEVSFTTVSIPKFLGTLITGHKTISFNDCMAQFFFFILLGVTEFYLLAAMSYDRYIAICKPLHYMSYDRYIAICKPLHYMTIMNPRVCILLVFASWLASFLIIFPSLMLFIQLDYCKSHVIDHFTCDYFPLLHLSCSDTKFLEIVGFSCAVFTLLFTLAIIILSYVYIIRTIVRLPSASQRTKAFSTCSSHMIVISISYGSCIFMYINPAAKDRVSLSKGVAVLNTSVALMLNPFIYSLRNQQVKRAFIDRARKIVYFSSK
ncbi:olfactory receptor 6C1-like [Ailuropoda melanoleuca]|uniref:olfactory receptor 6C1-like n=1 Tax=Ailuropoda melanoleuca TaxID=9646 RepID=UPI001494964F|nr:olfactory receptor 6C1-like [Ailuropoda melanoleuca]